MEGKDRGRPLKFETPELLENQIESYFISLQDPDDEHIYKRPPTVSGLAVFLDTSRETLMNYEARDEYFDAIKKAKERIHAFNEEQLYRNTQVTGVIFNLKNNFGWKDRNETDVTTKGQAINFNFDPTFNKNDSPSTSTQDNIE